MSKNFAALQHLVSDFGARPHSAQAVTEPETYVELIQRLFRTRSVVAIVGSGIGLDAVDVCGEIAAELAAAGRQVVVVRVDTLIEMNPWPLPDETNFLPGSAGNVAPNIWTWPEAAGQKIDFFKTRAPSATGQWLDFLRRHFDSVLLDCPAPQVTSGVTNVAAMADAAVLVVEAGRTPREKIRLDQCALQLGGVKLAGCILIQQR